jgi:hypothetical protein
MSEAVETDLKELTTTQLRVIIGILLMRQGDSVLMRETEFAKLPKAFGIKLETVSEGEVRISLVKHLAVEQE